MRDHEIKLILKWVGFREGAAVTKEMLVAAIQYAHQMGYTDGTGGGA
jgi:hypothetical protein